MKSGISLIAVLMFMLAATTASIVVFRYIGQENFASGARLKNSEAYQASQAGLEAVQGWLTNKGADAGAIIKQFKDQNNETKPVLLVSKGTAGTLNLLGSININNSKRPQDFEVYLTGIDVGKQPYQLKFMSVGKARDGAKYSQIGVFDVEGLYNISISRPSTPGTTPEVPAFHGGLGKNTQGKFSSATIIGDAQLNGLSTTGNLIVTGNLTVLDNTYSYIGCKNPPNSLDSAGNMYIVGSWYARGYKICGDAYIGGLLETTSNPQFRGHLYAKSGIKNNGIRVYKNATLGGDLIASTTQATFDGNLVMEENAQIEIKDGSNVSVGGSVWSIYHLGLFRGQNNSDKYKNLAMGKSGKSLYIQKPPAVICDGKENCNGYSYSWYQPTTSPNYAHFTSEATHIDPSIDPSSGNKLIYPSGANPLTSMAEQIIKNSSGKDVVEDPLEVPADMKKKWLEKGRRLDSLVSGGNTDSLPKSCIRLVKKPKNEHGDYDSHWGFGDDVSNCTPANYPSAGMKAKNGVQNQCTDSSSNDYNFIRAANDCYAALKNSDPKDVLYSLSSSEKFLALVVQNPQEKSPGQYDFLNGNFIFAYTADLGATMKLPPTTNNSKVFLYFEQGSTKSLPLENTCLGLPIPCMRNYFIFSEKDFAGSSGTATINGAIFLANGSKITGTLPDAIIEFNKDLYKALIDAGAIRGKKAGYNPTTIPPEDLKDNYYVPSTSHLKVSLQSRYASKEKIPKVENTDFIYAKPGILVLPRVVYLKEGTVASTEQLKKYYKVLYLNGAAPVSDESQAHECTFNENEKGTNKIGEHCLLTSKNNCGDLCKNHPFYVVTYNGTFSGGGSGGDGGDGSGGDEPGTKAPDGVTLKCTMPQSGTSFVYGTAVSTPSLTCSNGNSPTGTTWQPNIAWNSASLAPGSYNNIKAAANCGSGNITSNTCGSFSVMNDISITLTCTNISGNIEAGKAIPTSIALNLQCSNSTAPQNISYPYINNPPSAGAYSNVVVSADCGTAARGLQAQCPGTLNIFGLACSGLNQYVKAKATMTTPTLTCSPSGTASSVAWENAPGSGSSLFAVPDVPAGTNYNISAKATCGSISNLTASCGTTTVLGITCTGLPTSAQKGSQIAKPNISCISGDNAENGTFYQSTSDYQYTTGGFNFPWTLGTAARYFVTAQAKCGSETGLRANCGVVNVVDNSICQYNNLCPGIALDKVITASQNGDLGGNGIPICVFATSIAKMGNSSTDNPLKVNGVTLKKKDNNTEYGRCGREDWGQRTCDDALANANVQKVDGGYYIYIPNWVGDFQTTGGTPFCSGGTNPCDYNPDWCGGNSYGVNWNGDGGITTNILPSKEIGKKKCSFIVDFNSISYGNGSTLVINGIEYSCKTNGGCTIPTAPKPTKADGGYYVYLKDGTISWNITFPGKKSNPPYDISHIGRPECKISLAANCKDYVGTIPPELEVTPPLNPLTACFKYNKSGSKYNGKCYVCDDTFRNRDEYGLWTSCWSSWYWNGEGKYVEENLNATPPKWYHEVPCE